MSLLKSVHVSLQPPTQQGETLLCTLPYMYCHYRCDGVNDSGWGCAYRTLQSICTSLNGMLPPPSINQIQETLVRIGDKPQTFINSRNWIGTLEVSYVIDTLYDVQCRILHVPQMNDFIPQFSDKLKEYFRTYGGFAMMGGNIDAASKGIAGVHITDSTLYLLVVDPHFVGCAKTADELIDSDYVKWLDCRDLVDGSFYNICLPLINRN